MLSFLLPWVYSRQAPSSGRGGVQHTAKPNRAAIPRRATNTQPRDGVRGSKRSAQSRATKTSSHSTTSRTGPPPPPPHCRRSQQSTHTPAASSELDFSSDEEMETEDAETPIELQWERAYHPPPAWEWARDEPITHIKLLKALRVGPLCTTNLQRGLIGLKPVTFIERRWGRTSDVKQTGLFAELKLYTSDRYLRPLQGVVVSNLINVYDDIHAVSLIMEPPHPTCWIHASSNMPYILKMRVVEAYAKLHKRGIMHGSSTLTNILISPDCRVTLQDFAKARAVHGITALNLDTTSKSRLHLEMREVMYRIDFHGARKREIGKMQRLHKISENHQYVRDLVDLHEKGIIDGPVPPYEWPPSNDIQEPCPTDSHWHSWNDNPRDLFEWIDVPGHTPEYLQEVKNGFYALVDELTEKFERDKVSPILTRLPGFPLPVPAVPPFVDSPAPKHLATTSLGKRSASPDVNDEERPPKRPRLDDESTSENGPRAPTYKFSSTSYSTGTSEKLLTADPSAPATAVKARDFASEPYRGPRGFYVPHPPTEYMMSAHRTAHILNTNAIRCGLMDLPYFRGDLAQLIPPMYRRSVSREMANPLGNLKRKRAVTDGTAPATDSEEREQKRARFEEDRELNLAENRKTKFNDVASVCSGPPKSVPSHSWRPTPRSALKKTRAVRTVSYDLQAWLPPDSPQDLASSPDPAGETSRASASPSSIAEEGRLVAFGADAEGSPDDVDVAESATDPHGTRMPELGSSQRSRVSGTSPAGGIIDKEAGIAHMEAAKSRTPDRPPRVSQLYWRRQAINDREEEEVRSLLSEKRSSRKSKKQDRREEKKADESGLDEDIDRKEEDVIGPLKTMMDDICVWQLMRDPYSSELWDEE